uniref:Aspartyl/Asparaginyl beta-hydroxylase n=1 Tax=uncultured bacterium A1Q1_fos_500 TaxID=1256579 RepID=L7VSH4_9BACT|nr:aspartyl/Asparaginyl beta-hydroxylase [uncultured bacterium A1Q1_fos_500]
MARFAAASTHDTCMSVAMTTPYLRLPLSFDVARLQGELAGLNANEWITHFNTNAYEGGWSCVPLRSVGGVAQHIMPIESDAFADTPVLARCPYVREVLTQFKCETTSVRFMALAPGAHIKPHRDPKTSLEDGVTRLHVPIQTSPEVLFYIDGTAVHFSAGDAWYLNASCEHAVINPSPQPRVHLMLDCITNEWLEALFHTAGGVLRPPPPYPDPQIHDGNVLALIAQFRHMQTTAADEFAALYEAIYQQRQSTRATS